MMVATMSRTASRHFSACLTLTITRAWITHTSSECLRTMNGVPSRQSAANDTPVSNAPYAKIIRVFVRIVISFSYSLTLSLSIYKYLYEYIRVILVYIFRRPTSCGSAPRHSTAAIRTLFNFHQSQNWSPTHLHRFSGPHNPLINYRALL